MSFRARLRLFFVLIVILPMLAVAIVLFRLISDNETGKADADIAARQQTVINLYKADSRRAERVVARAGSDRVLAESLVSDNVDRARRRGRQMLPGRRIERIALTRGKDVVFDVGHHDAIAPGRRDLTGTSGQSFGVLEASPTPAARFAAGARRAAGADVVLVRDGVVLASTLRGKPPDPPRGRKPKDVQVANKTERAVTWRTPDWRGSTLEVMVVSPEAQRSSNTSSARLKAALILAGFLALALTAALAVSRSLQSQIGAFLQAARRLGSGDFSTDVPTPGQDEFAELGEEFNKMSRQLAERLEDLRRQRARLESSVRRIGESFASNLDRDALLEIVVRTAVESVEAEGGRVCLRPGPDAPLEERARAGDLSGLGPAIRAVESDVLESGTGTEAKVGSADALAHPLHGADGPSAVLGLVSVARRDREFTPSERDLFGYLAAQAAVSIENVGLHETVQRQAVTDELTGLYNHRRFQEAIESEAERAKRFGQNLGLVMLDIDDFKQVNDSYGHQQGDRVLAEVARILKDSSREIDAPARYGGEELAVVLPGTDIEGAFNLAERVRHEIEGLRIPLPDGNGSLQVTASLGVASSTASDHEEPRALLARADAALYEAKRSGKNKVVRAG